MPGNCTHTLSLTHTFTHTLSLTHAHTLTHTNSLSHTLTQTFTATIQVERVGESGREGGTERERVEGGRGRNNVERMVRLASGAGKLHTRQQVTSLFETRTGYNPC